MKKSFAFGICAVAALALTMGGCSKNSEAKCCDGKDTAACCKSGEKKADGSCCKGACTKSTSTDSMY